MLVAKLKAKHDALLKTKLPPEEVAKLIKRGAFLLDVRSRIEAKVGMVPGATSIPLGTLKRHMDELPRERDIVTFCGTGARAGKAKEVLDAQGFKAWNGGAYKDVLKVVGAMGNARPSR